MLLSVYLPALVLLMVNGHKSRRREIYTAAEIATGCDKVRKRKLYRVFAAREIPVPKVSWAHDHVDETPDYPLMSVRRFAPMGIFVTQSLVRRPFIRLRRENNPTEG